jgi:hypothetical protein
MDEVDNSVEFVEFHTPGVITTQHLLRALYEQNPRLNVCLQFRFFSSNACIVSHIIRHLPTSHSWLDSLVLCEPNFSKGLALRSIRETMLGEIQTLIDLSKLKISVHVSISHWCTMHKRDDESCGYDCDCKRT